MDICSIEIVTALVLSALAILWDCLSCGTTRAGTLFPGGRGKGEGVMNGNK